MNYLELSGSSAFRRTQEGNCQAFIKNGHENIEKLPQMREGGSMENGNEKTMTTPYADATHPPNYRPATCCQSCGRRGEGLLNGAFRCDLHRRPVMGWELCDDWKARGEA